MKVHYLEFVTPDVNAACLALSSTVITFSEPVEVLGNARIATLSDGSMIGVREPMRETEEPVTRAYLLVDNIESALERATEAGGEVAHPPLELPGFGTFAIYLLGGNQHGLWQL